MCDSDEYWPDEEYEEALGAWIASWTEEQKAAYEARCALLEKWKTQHAYVTSKLTWLEGHGMARWDYADNVSILRECTVLWPGLLEAYPELAARVAAILTE